MATIIIKDAGKELDKTVENIDQFVLIACCENDKGVVLANASSSFIVQGITKLINHIS